MFALYELRLGLFIGYKYWAQDPACTCMTVGHSFQGSNEIEWWMKADLGNTERRMKSQLQVYHSQQRFLERYLSKPYLSQHIRRQRQPLQGTRTIKASTVLANRVIIPLIRWFQWNQIAYYVSHFFYKTTGTNGLSLNWAAHKLSSTFLFSPTQADQNIFGNIVRSTHCSIYSNQPVAIDKFGGRVLKTSALQSRRLWVRVPPE